MPMLQIKLTNKYAGGYDHLDDWQEIGQFETLGTADITVYDEEHDDITDVKHTAYIVAVKAPEASDDDISRALTHCFTSEPCRHEFDCCGCRSFHASSVTRLNEPESNMWCVTVGSSRNY